LVRPGLRSTYVGSARAIKGGKINTAYASTVERRGLEPLPETLDRQPGTIAPRCVSGRRVGPGGLWSSSPEAPQGSSVSSLHAALLQVGVKPFGDETVSPTTQPLDPSHPHQSLGGCVQSGIRILERGVQPASLTELAPDVFEGA
jgi:hypothetical protein